MHKLQAAIKLDRMSLAFIISLVIQVVLIIHCIRSGRNTLWIWAIALLPLAGPVAYVLVEVLPGLFGSQGKPLEAIAIYQQALSGLYESDPNLLLGLAQAQYGAGAFADARATLDKLRTRNPDFRSPEGHLLYARALEGEGQHERALEEYAALTAYYAGAEAPLRYAQMLRACGRTDEARRVLKELMEHARLAPRHYRKMQQEWLLLAERELSAL